MARDWKPRPASRPTTITEVARRYHAAAVALSRTLGLSLAEVLAQHRESVTAIFIECGRSDLRVAAGVKLPRLAMPESPANGHPGAAAETNISANNTFGAEDPVPRQGGEEAHGNAPALPTSIPADENLPCAGQEIALLKPAALAMLIGKVATLAHAEGAAWAPLLHALTREREARLAQGRRPRAVVPPPNGAM
jgi:hypothetical protein